MVLGAYVCGNELFCSQKTGCEIPKLELEEPVCTDLGAEWTSDDAVL